MTFPEADDQPRSMRDSRVRAQRRAMLGLPHMIALKTFAEKLRRPGSFAGKMDWDAPCLSRSRRVGFQLGARGLSTRDIEDTFTDEAGRWLLSRARR